MVVCAEGGLIMASLNSEFRLNREQEIVDITQKETHTRTHTGIYCHRFPVLTGVFSL